MPRSVPVLMYHHVLPEAGFIASNVEQFESQMKFLAESGYKTLSAEEFAAYKEGNLEVGSKCVMITFDDGWRDNYVYAYPILKHYGLKATLFLITEWIEKASDNVEGFEAYHHNTAKKVVAENPGKVALNWKEIEKMRDVFDFHSHSHTHRDAYFSEMEWQEDIATSQKVIEERLGYASEHFCWPRGEYNPDLVKLAKEEGFKYLYTTKRGLNMADGKGDVIKRLAVKKEAKWLKKNIFLFSNPLLGELYARIKPE